jgi:hypothetical protein
MCTNCCAGDAGTACILDIIGGAMGIMYLGEMYACCCWTPNPMMFMRNEMMHGKRPRQPADSVKGGGGMQPAVMMIQQPMMVQQPMMMQQPMVVQQQPMVVQQQPMVVQAYR